jgi:6-phosphogluconolactonase (cycloisomerase 2 family)
MPAMQIAARYFFQHGETMKIRFWSNLFYSLACLTVTAGFGSVNAQVPQGAVYVQTNALDGNEVAAFGRNLNGTLFHIGDYATGGLGSTEFDGGEGLDPLISADSVIAVQNEQFIVTVNAGSDTVTSFRIEPDFSLTKISTVSSGGVGPNSLAYSNGWLFVSNIDRDGFALGDPSTPRGEPNDEGNITGFFMNDAGVLVPLANSTIDLDNRPANLGFSADGTKLIVSSITAGSAALPGPNAANSVAVYEVNPDGSVGGMVGSATGTVVGNPEGRNLASAIDFDTTVVNGREFVVVTEAREFNAAGAPPALPALQAGSVSVYELLANGSLVETESDFSIGNPAGSPFDPSNQLTTCWIDFAPDGQTFFASNAINATVSSLYVTEEGGLNLLEATAAEGVSGFSTGGTTGPEVFGTTDGFIDLDVSADGRYLYQLEGLSGEISVYAIEGGALTLVQELAGYLPEIDTQGLVAVSGPPIEGAVYTMTNGLLSNEVVAFGINPGGQLAHLGNFPTGGAGSTEFDGGEGLDPLISADSIIVTENECLVCVNAGSDTISSFTIEDDLSLTLVSTINSGGVGPNSLAYSNGRVFVSNIDRDGFALGDPSVTRGEPNDEGNVTGFNINANGILTPIPGSTFDLDNRPADLGFSADGTKLIVTSITAGSAALPGPDAANSVAVLEVDATGAVTGMVGSATGTQVGNAAGRNLASAIDFDTAVIGGREFVVVTEAREFNALGAPPALPALQSGSVSVYELLSDGSLATTEEDFALGDPLGSPFDPGNQLTACWIDFGSDGSTFYVSNAINASISRLELLSDGTVRLQEQVAAAGVSGFANGGTTGPEVFGTTDGFIDLDVTDDGKYLYQLEGLSGAIGAYAINDDNSLSFVQQAVGFLPEIDTQGLVTFQRYGVEDESEGEQFLLGDFDLDGDVDSNDLDQYNGNIGASAVGALAVLDLNGNGTVDSGDFEQHYTSLVETSNGQTGTFAGDTNLDGVVDVLNDAFSFIANLNQVTTSWSEGDFNGDGLTNVLGDAFLLIGNLGNSNQ